MAKKQKLKQLSAHVVIVLAIIDEFGDEGAWLSEVVAGYEEIGLDVDWRSVCTYVNRVKGCGYVSTTQEDGDPVYRITEAGREELDWYRGVLTK